MILVAVLSAFFAIIVSSISMLLVAGANSDATISAIPGVSGCSLSPHGLQFFFPFILVFVFQLGIQSGTGNTS
ncbi:hypothetical protein BDR07DRAFT_1424498 [Suillus spraguei]|nr:hypothetical protein BDR07DRAFT_1424498 [Suillus spraguei]